MADLKKITLPSGTTYNLVDQGARDLIAQIESGTGWLGVTTTALTDGATTNPIMVNGESVTAKAGNLTSYGAKEFIFNGTVWQELGDMSMLGELAYKNSASGSYTPAGTVTKPTFTGTQGSINATFTPAGNVSITTGAGNVNYTPAGTVSTPTITVTPSTASITPINSVGELPELTMTVANETLTFGWDAGSLPTKGSAQTVVTGIQSASSSRPTFTGTGAELKASFTGTAGTATGSFTPSGTVSQPTFSGTTATIEVE